MAKVILWTNRDKSFKLLPAHISYLKSKNVTDIPQHVGNYDNFDAVFIKAIENNRSNLREIMGGDFTKWFDYRQKQSLFNGTNDSFIIYVTKFWVEFLELNPKLLNRHDLYSLYKTIMYRYTSDEFLEFCKKEELQIPNDCEARMNALNNRREVVSKLRADMDASHEEYRKYCANVGMNMFTHVPPNDGFEIVEYDETMFRPSIKLCSDKHGYKWEELTLMPL